MSLSTEFERVSLPLEYPFTISRGTMDAAENVVVRIRDDEGNEGIGAAAPSSHYGETADTVEAVLPDLLDAVERNPAARCAVSIALHDLVCKRLDVPLYRYWGLDPDEAVSTTYTIGIDSAETMREKTETAVERGHSALKVKVGTDRDEEIVSTVRDAAPDATIRVDANEAWSPREAVRKIDALAEYDLEFVEQPVPAGNPEGLKFVRDRSALPIAADESCIALSDIPRIADKADVANLKLMKCGGLREAERMIHAARAHGMEVMLGCMVESNAAIAAAAHLAPLLDYADLDGSLLLDDDPYDGVPMAGGNIDLAGLDRPGTGARVR